MDEQQLLQAQPQELKHLADGVISVFYADTRMAQLGMPGGPKGIPALLSWSKDGNYVQLAEVDASENEIRNLFLATPEQIDGADFSFNMYTFHVNNEKFVLFVRSAEAETMHAMSGANGEFQGAIPIIAGSIIGTKGNIAHLRELLAENNSQTTQPHLLKLFGWAIAVSVALLILLVLFLTLLSGNR